MNKWAYGANTIVSTIIFFVILILVVLIAEQKPLRVDLTQTGLSAFPDRPGIS